MRAATLAVVFVTDLRRVTRWVGLSEPVRSECELVREWDWRPGIPKEEAAEMEGRCCINGLEVCCISWKGTEISAQLGHGVWERAR